MRRSIASAWGVVLMAAWMLVPASAFATPDERRWSSVEAVLADVAPDARLARPVGPGNDGVFGEALGSAVALSGDTLLVGAPEDRIARLGILGSVYVFVREPAGWRLDAKLLAPDGASGDRFGAAVALDGSTAVVGAPGDDVGADIDRGAAHVFVRTVSGWQWQARLDAAGNDGGDRFGASVALEGDTALVGAPGVGVGGVAAFGAAWVFQRAGTAWAEQARLAAADGAANDSFGTAVALSGPRALVGAPAHGAAGAGYVFERAAATWAQQAKLLPSGAPGGANAGRAVALSVDLAVLGAPFERVGDNAAQGRAHVFARIAGQWSPQAVLAAAGGIGGERYGDAVAADGDLVAVSRPGALLGSSAQRGSVDVWRRVSGTWTAVHRIDPSDAAHGRFGTSLALDGSRLAVGAPDGIAGATVSGAASVFEGAGATLGAPAVLGAGEGPNGSLGEAVAIDGDTLVLGAPFERVDGLDSAGAAYVYVRSSGAWTLQQRVVAPVPGREAWFGRAVAMDGDTVVVGAPGDRGPGGGVATTARGAAWVFVRGNGSWTVQAQLVANGGAAFDFFANAVAIDGDTIACGVPNAVVGNNVQQGAVDVFTRGGSTWSHQARLVSGETGEQQEFGNALALDGQRIVAGSWRAGATWVFERTGSAWTRTARLASAMPADGFAWSVALVGDRLLVGAPFRGAGGEASRGAVDAFEHVGGQWLPRAQLTASDGQAQDCFGWSLALAGDTALVGNAPACGATPRASAAAYVFERRGSGWRQDARWRPQDVVASDRFAGALALSGRTAVVGAPGAAGAAPWGNPGEGAAYVYTHVPETVFFDDFEP